ncbi:MAG: hypothetical protein JWM96_1075 [Alphaproteobacteria bacterium]|nr:hypothetical protein [Alphaproteobacteria bacterium]
MSFKRQTLLLVMMIATGLAFAVSIFTVAYSQTAAPPRGPYMIAAAGDDRNTIWRIDQSTGRVSYCMRNITSMDAQLIASRPPFCSAWSP